MDIKVLGKNINNLEACFRFCYEYSDDIDTLKSILMGTGYFSFHGFAVIPSPWDNKQRDLKSLFVVVEIYRFKKREYFNIYLSHDSAIIWEHGNHSKVIEKLLYDTLTILKSDHGLGQYQIDEFFSELGLPFTPKNLASYYLTLENHRKLSNLFTNKEIESFPD